MTYNREELLKIFASAILYEGKKFHEGMNEDLLYSLDGNFYKYDYNHGATKLVIIPKKEDFVIKIPYTGSYEYYSGYYSNSIYRQGREDYWEFVAGENPFRPWDYCANEIIRYDKALENGFAKYFAKTELLGFIHNYPIYIQEKCVTLSSDRHFHRYSKEENLKTSNCYKNYYNISINCLTDFRLKYGEEEREKNGRLFSDFTEKSLRALTETAGGFRITDMWLTRDARPDRQDESWVNMFCVAEKAE